MLKKLRNNTAQVIIGEYLIVFFLIVAVMSAMTIYFKRSIQARIRDSRLSMYNTIFTRTTGYYNGNLYSEYEPYYAETEASVDRNEDDSINILPGASSGIFQKTINDFTSTQINSETVAPRFVK